MIRGRTTRLRSHAGTRGNAPSGLTNETTERIRGLVRGDWYRHHNHDVAISGRDPVEHYLSVGLAENRNPNPLFNALWYLENHEVPDGTPAFLHHLETGRRERARPHVAFNIEFYEQWMDDEDERTHLEHYRTDGWH